MRAARLKEYAKPLEIEDVDAPEIDEGGALVKVDACGVCRSDWHAWQGNALIDNIHLPHTLGHEPAGTVVEVGENVEEIVEGDNVVIPFNLCCGRCSKCRNGHENMCENLLATGFEAEVQGAFGEYIYVPNADFNAVRLPDGIDAVDAAGMGCRFMTAFHALSHRGEIRGGDTLSVYGVGGVGLSAVHIGSKLGANVIAVDIVDEKLEKATELGATHTVNPKETDPVDAIQDITDGGADFSIDAIGSPETCRQSVNSVDTMGAHIQIGLLSEEVTLPIREVQLNEIDIRGSRGMQPSRLDEIFNMVESGKLEPQKIVSEQIALEEVSETLDRMTNYETQGIPVIDSFQ